jgi:signal transduction histidine kinase
MEERKDLFLIFKEAMNNAAKYAECNEIKVGFEKFNDNFIMTIADNGKGFNTENTRRGNGLDNMKKRSMMHRGNVEIFSSEKEGTTVKLQMHIP